METGVLDSIAKFISSPPGQLAAGGVIAGVVWKFFERIEALLTDDTKLQIAVWLLDLKIKERVDSWPQTFIRLFDRVFGNKHISLKCFLRSCLASYGAFLLCLFASMLSGIKVSANLAPTSGGPGIDVIPSVARFAVVYSLFLNVVPDYVSLLTTRVILSFAARTKSALGLLLLLALDFYLTAVIAAFASWFGALLSAFVGMKTLRLDGRPFSIGHIIYPTVMDVIQSVVFRPFSPMPGVSLYWYFPAFFTSVWLWLYAGSGFLLKAARRFDIGFAWFNRHFDIEKKPLQSVGLVAGALAAAAYWTFQIIHHIV